MKRVLLGVIPVLAVLSPSDARACGCFTMPSVATPVVQAGERILFAHDGNQVVAYIQIQYQGSANQFGWLVPLPSVPTLQLGTDELFTKLGSTTQPQFQLTSSYCNGATNTSSSSSGIGCGAAEEDNGAFAAFDLGMYARPDMGQMNPVVVQSSIGPYDYAVLKADDMTEMQKWLDDNGYFVPDATGNAVKPYIHSGGYFLALKLQAGEQTGDIVPIVLKYASDLPMIPITLTQVGAIPNMGVLVWVLGESRAIPRNYYHTVLDEMPIWVGGSYQTILTNAVQEAPGKHSFVTEYAGSSSVMRGQLYYAGRFGNLALLRTITDPSQYLSYLQTNGYTFDSTLFALLQRFLPPPPQAINFGVTPDQFYTNYDYYEQLYGGSWDGGVAPEFDPAGLTDAIDMRIVEPTRTTQSLFDQHPYVTRLYTTLSPEDMNLDPVFSQNPELADVPLLHSATLTYPCSGDPWLATDSGMEVQYTNGLAPFWKSFDPELRLETLRESGQPQVVTDHTDLINGQLGPVTHGSTRATSSSSSGGGSSGCACDVSSRTRNQLGTALMVFIALAFVRRRRIKKE